MTYRIHPSTLQGQIRIPPSKSHTLRAILFASLAHGDSVIQHYLPSPDTDAMIQACTLLGATIQIRPDKLHITGVNGKPKTPANVIDAGNSGQVLRFVAAVAALTEGYTVITGDDSVRTLRPVQPLLDGLSPLGVFAVSTQGNGSAPILVKGPFLGGRTQLDGADSQPVSALLIAAAFAPHSTVIEVTNPGEKPWVDLTLDWLTRLGVTYQREGYIRYTLPGNSKINGFTYTVPGDFSSCAFPLVGALITGSKISLYNLDMHDVQGDKVLVDVLQTMGADIKVDNVKKALHIQSIMPLRGQTIDVNACIDALPILAVVACFAQGMTTIEGAAIARKKESDRIAVISQMLQRMGAQIEETAQGMRIHPSPLRGARVSSFSDHRIAMALAIAGLAAEGETVIEGTQCITKSYPDFLTAMQALGANMDCQT